MNKPGLIIILYDDNERIAPQAATVFVEKGVENIFLLSGGDPFVLVYMHVQCTCTCFVSVLKLSIVCEDFVRLFLCSAGFPPGFHEGVWPITRGQRLLFLRMRTYIIRESMFN